MQVSHKNGIEDGKGNIISELWYKYIPYWPLFISLITLSILGGWVYLRYATPIFETTASLLVKDQKKGVDDSNLMEQLDLFGSKKLVENEIEVIKSRMLIRQVVDKLYLYSPITSKGRIRSSSAYQNSPVSIEAQNPDSLVEEKKVFFNVDSATGVVSLGHQKIHLNTWFNDGANVIRFINNQNYRPNQEKKPLYFDIIASKSVTDGIVEILKVAQATKLSSVIDISLRDAVPKRGEDILNQLIIAYNKAAIDDKNVQSSNTLKFINERLGLVLKEIDSVELGIQKYKTAEGIVDISAQGQAYLDNASLNDQKLSQINVQLAVLDQVEKYVKSKDNKPGIVPSTFGIDDAGLAQLLGKLYDIEVQYEGLRKTTAENNPLLLSLQLEIDKMKPNILENVQNLRKNLDAGRTNLAGNSSRFSSVLKKLPQKERGLIEVSRQQIIKNGIYSFLLQKREENALTLNSAIADTRIVDNADTTIKPVSPKKVLIYLFALILAVGSGAGVIAIREVLNQTIVFRSEIEQFTAAPVIGEIMQEAASDGPIVIEEGRRTVVAEQFRQLRTSLAYIGINTRKKRLLVTSNISGEGKSFLAGNLAVSLALTDKKVVLLEMDLRKPKLSKMFGVTREVGLSNFFIGNKDADQIIKSTTTSANLFIIPSGAIPPNPSELIVNGKLEELLKYLETIFDYIVIDTAPISPVTDAYIISPMCDATLFVIRHKVTPKAFVQLLDENIRMKGLKNVAVVFNGVKGRGIGQYGYGYGYGYTGKYAYEDASQATSKKERSFWKKLSK